MAVSSPLSRDTTPGIGPGSSPAASADSRRGKASSASPTTATSIQSTDRTNSSPMSPSKLAPPKTVTSLGCRAFNRRASANEAVFCWKLEVNPTTSVRCQSMRFTIASKNLGTYLAAYCQ